MKKRKGLTIKINLSNRWLYFLITLGILLVIGVGVWAYAGPSGVGHGADEIEGLMELQYEVNLVQDKVDVLQDMVDELGAGGGITVETDPTVPSSLKDGVQCSFGSCGYYSAYYSSSWPGAWSSCPTGRFLVSIRQYVSGTTQMISELYCCAISCS